MFIVVVYIAQIQQCTKFDNSIMFVCLLLCFCFVFLIMFMYVLPFTFVSYPAGDIYVSCCPSLNSRLFIPGDKQHFILLYIPIYTI